jgi:hypothetical protein
MRTLDTPLFAALALSMAPAVLIVGCSSLEGQSPTPLTTEELSAIRAHHLDSAVYEQP